MRILLFLTLFLLMAMPVLAYDNTTYTCADASVSHHEDYVNGTFSEEYVTCPFGCMAQTGDCAPNYYSESYIMLWLILPFLSLIFFYLAFGMAQEDWAIHLMFIFTGFLLIILPLGILSNAYAFLTPFYVLIIAVMVLFFAYTLIKIIIKGTQMMSGGR